MPKVSKQTATLIDDFGVAEDRHEDLDGYTVNFVSIRQTHNLAPSAQGAAGRQLLLPALGIRHQGPDHGALRRPRGDHRGGRRVLSATGACPRSRGGHRDRPVQPGPRAGRGPTGHEAGDAGMKESRGRTSASVDVRPMRSSTSSQPWVASPTRTPKSTPGESDDSEQTEGVVVLQGRSQPRHVRQDFVSAPDHGDHP